MNADKARLALDLRAQGATWAAVAEANGYANGSAARQALERYLAKAGAPAPAEPEVDDDEPQPKVNGRNLERGTELSITGERGRFTFLKINTDGSALCWGGPTGHEKMRDFRIDRVRTVHRKNKIRKNQENHQ